MYLTTGVAICLALVCAIHLPNDAEGAKILGVLPTAARSHFIVGSALMKELARRGHEVTVISPFPQKKPLKNYRDITVHAAAEETKKFIPNLFDIANMGIVGSITKTYKFGQMLTNATLQEPNVVALINSKEQFDLVILEIFLNDAHFGFVQRFNAPCVALSTFGASKWTTQLVGTPSPPSFVPHPFLSFTDRMSFVERVGNMAMNVMDLIVSTFIDDPVQNVLYENAFPNPKPSLKELKQHAVSLVLLNQHFSLSYPRPYVPNMVEVGGMHINRVPNPLPEDIQSFMDNATDGVIYFSMGSNLQSTQLPIEKRQALLNVFARLKQRVMWKWEDENLPNKPSNVLVKKWFPQDDVLAHPNVRLFITHGGLLSSTESLYHGVPVVGIPVFGDQYLNMGKAERTGYGLMVPYQEITEQRLSKAINEILSDAKYRTSAKAISARYRDQVQNPLDLAVFWVEYVLRHKGAEHIKSAAQHLSFFQYHSVDVLAVLIGGPILALYLLVTLLFGRKGKKAAPVRSTKKRN